ncbi:MAG: hypothetical protein A3Q59_01500 [Methanomethylophilus alvi]|nr:MAG: hypothetical protein A3Q59_01500 [Methanomethylophilus alvi]
MIPSLLSDASLRFRNGLDRIELLTVLLPLLRGDAAGEVRGDERLHSAVHVTRCFLLALGRRGDQRRQGIDEGAGPALRRPETLPAFIENVDIPVRHPGNLPVEHIPQVGDQGD